jgi:hypothetical protein
MMAIEKKKLFYRYTDFITLQNIGAFWQNQIEQYFPFGVWVSEIAFYTLVFERFGVPFWLIVVFVVGKCYFDMFLRWVIGKIIIKTGIYEAQNQYTAKKQEIAPYEKENRETLKSLCNAVGAKHHFTEL